MNKQEFLNFVEKKCINHGIIFKISNDNTIKTEMLKTSCSGFFEENQKIKPTLGIAGLLSDQLFFEVLAHEFSHAMQWVENSIYWTQSRLTPSDILKYQSRIDSQISGLETGDILSLWLDSAVELSPDELEDLTIRTTAVEFDCESRTVDLIRSSQLEIDSDTYAQKANAYLITYFFSQKTRKWTKPGHALYTKPEFYSLMPTKINSTFCKNISTQLINIILENYC